MMNLTQLQFIEAKKTADTVLLPIGMIETHGPHSSLGTDVWIPREFVRRLDKVIGDRVIMAPEVPYGHSWSLAPFEGTIDISAEAFTQYVYEIGKEFHRNSFNQIILFNGHGGNIPSLMVVSEKLADLGMKVLTINWWTDYREQILEITKSPGHGGEDETSLMLAIDEKLADPSIVGEHKIMLNPKIKFPKSGKVMYKDGFSGNAGNATAENGEKLFQLMLKLVLKDIEDLWSVNYEPVNQ
ncbi:creatininase family protein [Neobacillus niacini]|uniref:creatininase family protein n=1 Tax=Neobacillus niacini TaxID=86668 RepID=UPI0021CB158E|nr:creatininase family protein [Neobacillus niacini]MCM3764664.1 creatininase family protein [Neobacillus niacini]